MARLLIVSYPDDVHAYEVALALEDQGHQVDLWYGPDFPVLQSASLRFDGGRLSWSADGPRLLLQDTPFDSVWFRRPSAPVLPDELDPADRPIAQRECQDFVDGMWQLIAPDAFWVNPLSSRHRANLKAVQLMEAMRAGFAIPPTLMSNQPAAIRDFVGSDDPTIYKAFYPAQWEHGENVAILLTSELRSSQLPADEILRLTPGIFQRRIAKSHELRVNVLGNEVIAAGLRSQESSITQLDWRASAAALPVEAVELDSVLAERCRELIRRLGLVFGCIDLIVTPEKEVVFLEVNSMGQFLWIEDQCPELTLLDRFCSFLVSGRADFTHSEGPPVARHQQYYQRAVERLDACKSEHESRVESFVSRDRPESFSSERSGDRGSEARG